MTPDLVERCVVCHGDVDIDPPLYDSQGRPFCLLCADYHIHGDDE